MRTITDPGPAMPWPVFDDVPASVLRRDEGIAVDSRTVRRNGWQAWLAGRRGAEPSARAVSADRAAG